MFVFLKTVRSCWLDPFALFFCSLFQSHISSPSQFSQKKNSRTF